MYTVCIPVKYKNQTIRMAPSTYCTFVSLQTKQVEPPTDCVNDNFFIHACMYNDYVERLHILYTLEKTYITKLGTKTLLRAEAQQESQHACLLVPSRHLTISYGIVVTTPTIYFNVSLSIIQLYPPK
jgi:hypothetical protein